MKKTLLLIGILFLIGTACAAHRADQIKVGEPSPEFTLADIEGKTVSLTDFKGQYVLLEWVNHGCPFVKKHYNSGNMPSLQKEMTEKDIVWLSICSSAEGKQGYYSAKEWQKLAKEKEMNSTAILLDPEGKMGRAYQAKTTPHMYIVDPEGILVYMGAIDDKPTTDLEDIEGAHNYVRAALEEVMEGEPVSQPVTRPYGCSVKY